MVRNACFTVVLLAALALLSAGIDAPAADAHGTLIPIFGDDFIASVRLGGDLLIAPAALGSALAEHAGQPVTTSTLTDALDDLPMANGSNSVRMYGCYAAGSAASLLTNASYDMLTVIPSDMPAVAEIGLYTD